MILPHCNEVQFFVMPLYRKSRAVDRLFGKIFVSVDSISASVIAQIDDHRLRQASAHKTAMRAEQMPPIAATTTASTASADQGRRSDAAAAGWRSRTSSDVAYRSQP